MPRLILAALLAPCLSASLLAQSLHTLTAETIVFHLELAPGEPPLQASLAQIMSIYKDPGFSVAVIDHGHLAWARGFGVTSVGQGTPVTPHTLFQAASISKPVTAAGVLWLVDHGKLSLDEDVNRKLKSWQVPGNQFTAAGAVTLRRILSHNAGFNVHGFDGYSINQALPTTRQTLDGLPPANNPPIRIVEATGSVCDYSGGGYTVAGLVVRDVSGQSFETFMRQHVLLPAGMRESTFDQVLPPSLATKAASGTDSEGKTLPGKWRLFPELAPDGLWTTPSDLAKFAIEIASSMRGKANHIMSQNSAHQMLTVQCHDDPTEGTGLGFALGYQRQPSIFFHNGSNAGFQSVLMMHPDAGWGYVAMANSDKFQMVNRAVFTTLSEWYGWGVGSDTRDLGENLTVVHALRDAKVAIAYYQRVRSAGFVGLRHNVNTLNNFGYRLLGEKDLEDAIRVFELNVAQYPENPNVYDSLGEAYMDAGQRDLAIQNYEMSLKLDPKNDNAVKRLKQLRAN